MWFLSSKRKSVNIKGLLDLSCDILPDTPIGLVTGVVVGTRVGEMVMGEYFNCEISWWYRLNQCRCVGLPLLHCTFCNILLTSLTFLLRAETTNTQMREHVSLAIPAWSKHDDTDKRTARTDTRGHLEGLLIWERWELKMGCRGEENLGLGSGCSGTGMSCAMSSKPRASRDGVCDQGSSCRASSAGGTEPCSWLLITAKPICQQIVLKLACKVLSAFLVSNCLKADTLLLL